MNNINEFSKNNIFDINNLFIINYLNKNEHL